MLITHLNKSKLQIGDLANLAHLDDENLDDQLKLFLLACTVNSLSTRSIEDYRQKIGAFVTFCRTQEIYKLHQVTPGAIRLFLLGIQQRCKPSSVHGYYGAICRFFNWLVEEGTLKESPMARMHPPRVPRELIKPFKPEHIQRLLAVCDYDCSKPTQGKKLAPLRNRAIILTFLDTGLRLSELANIQLSDVDFDREAIKVMGKGSKERLVRIGKGAQKALLRYVLLRNDDLPCLWITEEGKPLQPGGIQQMMKRLGQRAGITGVRCSCHTFRHTFAILCLRNSMGEFTLQILLGHSTLSQTRRYTNSLNADDAFKAHMRASPVDNLKL
jgi:integrase/recombinase XerC/integrase/recombinase XerD